MLNRKLVEAEEERPRREVAALPAPERRRFYDEVRSRVRDPDTYAVANYAVFVGAHHFYLGRWGRGFAALLLFIGALLLLATPLQPLGVVTLLGVLVVELYSLFRSEVIVQDYNNQAYRSTLEQFKATPRSVVSNG